MNYWIIAGIIAAILSPTITILISHTKILVKLTKLEETNKYQDEKIDGIEDFVDLCKAGKDHKRPFRECYKIFLSKENYEKEKKYETSVK